METNKKIMLMMTKIIINMVNDDNDNVQPLDNFSIEIANGHSWLIIMPSLYWHHFTIYLYCYLNYHLCFTSSLWS